MMVMMMMMKQKKNDEEKKTDSSVRIFKSIRDHLKIHSLVGRWQFFYVYSFKIFFTYSN